MRHRGLGPRTVRVGADASSRESPLKTLSSENTRFKKMQPALKDDMLVGSSGSRCRGRVRSAGRLRGNNAIKGKGRRKQDFAGKVSDQDADLTSVKGKRSASRFGQQDQNILWFCQSLSQPKDSRANNSN